MAELLDRRWDGTDSSPLKRVIAAGDEVFQSLEKSLATATPAKLNYAFGDSREFLVAIRFPTEAELEAAAKNGSLLVLAGTAFAKVAEKVKLTKDSDVVVRFNSQEYVSREGDGFHRARQGDWRDDFEFRFDAVGAITKQPKVSRD